MPQGDSMRDLSLRGAQSRCAWPARPYLLHEPCDRAIAGALMQQAKQRCPRGQHAARLDDETRAEHRSAHLLLSLVVHLRYGDPSVPQRPGADIILKRTTKHKSQRPDAPERAAGTGISAAGGSGCAQSTRRPGLLLDQVEGAPGDQADGSTMNAA